MEYWIAWFPLISSLKIVFTLFCLIQYVQWLHAVLTYPESSAESQPHADRRTSRAGGSCPHTLACPHWCHCGWGWPPPPGWPRSPECHCFEEGWAPDTPPRTPSCPPEPLGCRAGRWDAALPGHRMSRHRTRSLSALGSIWWLWWRQSLRCAGAGWWRLACALRVHAQTSPLSAHPASWCGRRAADGSGGRSLGRVAGERTAGSWGSSGGMGQVEEEEAEARWRVWRWAWLWALPPSSCCRLRSHRLTDRRESSASRRREDERTVVKERGREESGGTISLPGEGERAVVNGLFCFV